MRTPVLCFLINSFVIFCISWAADIPLKNFNSSTDLIEEHRHFHLDSDKTTKTHDNETYATETPHKGHEKSTTGEHRHHETPEFQNAEPEIIDFFRAASEDAVYGETQEEKHDPGDVLGIPVLHMTGGDDFDRAKLSKVQKDGNHMEAAHDGRTMEAGHDKHSTEVGHNGHTMDPDNEMGDHDGHDHHMKMDMNDTGSMHGMMMYFHTGVNEIILFKQWKITTIGGLIGSMIGIILLAMLYEGLKYFREHLFKKYVASIQFSTVAVTGQSGRVTQVHKVERHHMMSWPHALQTILHVVQIVMSYFLMLIFMTYNVWLCLAVVFGAGLGYFIFGWKKATVVDITEHCH